MGDNREYEYKADRSAHREKFSKIVDWIPEGSRVLDLGCGEGSLLKLFVEKKKHRWRALKLALPELKYADPRG